MSDGRTFWYPEDARWLSWERVVMLGEEFGAAAISVLVAVKCEAKLQNAGWRVKAGWRSLGREAFVDPDIVHSIVVRAAELGVLDDLEEKDEFTFTARVSGMAASERKARDAARKAAARAVADGADTCGHDRTPEDKSDATGPREEKRREEDRTEDNSTTDPVRVAVAAWESLGLTINPFTYQQLTEAVDEWSESGHPEYVTLAIEEAGRQNKRSWAYVEGILKRCRADGTAPIYTNGKTEKVAPKPKAGTQFVRNPSPDGTEWIYYDTVTKQETRREPRGAEEIF